MIIRREEPPKIAGAALASHPAQGIIGILPETEITERTDTERPQKETIVPATRVDVEGTKPAHSDGQDDPKEKTSPQATFVDISTEDVTEAHRPHDYEIPPSSYHDVEWRFVEEDDVDFAGTPIPYNVTIFGISH